MLTTCWLRLAAALLPLAGILAPLQAAETGQPATAPGKVVGPAAAPGKSARTAAAADVSPDELRVRIMDLAGRGKLTDEALRLFKLYAAAGARTVLQSSDLPDDFWPWLAADKVTYEAFLLALYPDYPPGPAQCLVSLRKKFGPEIDSHRHLALAFALVWGQVKDREPIAPPVRPKERLAPAPTMEESFAYYLKHEKALRLPLKKMPWNLLVYLADNDLPIAEREWVLNRYGKLELPDFRVAYRDPPFDEDAFGGQPSARGDMPYTLEAILSKGGVSVDRAYYASRVYKSLGVPAMFDRGDVVRGEHAWVAWVAPPQPAAPPRGWPPARPATPPKAAAPDKAATLELNFFGRRDFDSYFTGEIHEPLRRKYVLDRDVQLMVAGTQQSYAGYYDAVMATHIYEFFDKAHRPAVIGLLKDAVNRNACCAAPWRELAQAGVDGTLAARDGELVYENMLKALKGYPDLTFEVLARLLSPRLAVEPGAAVDEESAKRNLALLEKAFDLYDKSRRPDLAVKLKSLQGQYLEAINRAPEALKLYVAGAESYAAEHYGFIELFDRALRLLSRPENWDQRTRFLEQMANKVPEYTDDLSRKYELKNRSFVHVVEIYVKFLQQSGQQDEADKWAARLKKKEEPAK